MSSPTIAPTQQKLLVTDPAQLCLPALTDPVPSEGPRVVKALDLPLECKFGAMWAMIGHSDIRGRGQHVPQVPHVDPFVMCNYVSLPPGRGAPFCAHPHCGASIVSIFLSGGGMMPPWDNVRGPESRGPLLPGGVYHVDSGAGCVHDEQFEPVATRARTKPSFDPVGPPSQPCAAEGDDGHSRMMQLWWNAIDMDQPEDAPLRPVTTGMVHPDEVPCVLQDGDGIGVRVLAGEYRGKQCKLSESITHPVLLLHVRVLPHATGTLGPLPPEYNGFAWMTHGACAFGSPGGSAAVVAERGETGMVLLPPGGSTLMVANNADAEALFVLALGRPQRKPYYKYVGYGGGFIHRSRDAVEAAIGEYERAPAEYGRVAAGDASRPISLEAYEMVGGFQENGGEMLERPEGLPPARFKWAPGKAPAA
jgi:redox-sensitive bicupin YhaK (pirin superfamily)